MDEAVSREVHDAVVAQLAAANARIAELERQVAQLLEEKGRNSSNSNKPPSSDSPKNRAERRAAKAKERSGKKRGGQPGHEGSQRALLPADEFKDHFPDECENCFSPLPKTPDASPLRYQTTELPPVKPHTLEHRVHCVTCPHCRHKTTAAFEIPPGFGPRLWSMLQTAASASSTLPGPAKEAQRYAAHNLIDGDVATVWCEGDAGDGRGSTVTLAFDDGGMRNIAAVGIVPGYVRTDWLYEANAAPARVRLRADTAHGVVEGEHALPLPASAMLFAERADVLQLPFVARDATRLTVTFLEVRAGAFAKDMCVSELFVVDQLPVDATPGAR